MPAAMRAAISCVLPEPAPASTIRLRPSSETMRSRAGWSARGLLMARQPVTRREARVALLGPGLRVRGGATRGTVVAELAVLLVARVDEEPGRDDVAQIGEHLADRCGRLRRNALAFEPPLGAGEVVLRARDRRLRRAPFQQFQ